MKHKTGTEFAKMIGVSRQAVYNALENGRIKGEKVGGRYWIITDSEVKRILEYIKSRKANGYKLAFFPSKRSK